MLELHDLKAVVFDLDGTLVDSTDVTTRAFNLAVEPFGVTLGHDDFERIRSRSAHELFMGYVPPESHAVALERLHGFAMELAPQVSLFFGIRELLEDLRSRRVPLAVWTGRDRRSAQRMLEANGIFECFEAVVGNGCTERNKPSPDGLILISRQLGLEPSTLLMVGDHRHDLEGAAAAGAVSALAGWSVGASAKAMEGTTRFASVMELRERLAAIQPLDPVAPNRA